MAIFNHIPMGEEGLKEIYQWLDDWVANNKGLARKEVIGKSPDHWDIPAIFITNEDVSNDDKQIAVITLGRHGQELGTRVVGPEINLGCKPVAPDPNEIEDEGGGNGGRGVGQKDAPKDAKGTAPVHLGCIL